MIYFDTEKEAYSQKETLLQWGKILLLECSDEDFAKLQLGEKIWQDNKIVDNQNYDKEQLEKAKTAKLDENALKAKAYEQNGTVEYKNCLFEMSDSNRKNLSDTQEALSKAGKTETQWNTKTDELTTLTVDDIQYVRLNLILGAIQKLWINDYPTYKAKIEACTTIDEVNAINIVYPVIDVSE